MEILEFGFKTFHTICGVCGTHMEYTLEDVDLSYDKFLVECPICGTKCIHTKDNGYVRYSRKEIEQELQENEEERLKAANKLTKIGFGNAEEEEKGDK